MQAPIPFTASFRLMIRSGQFLTLALAFFLGACSSPQPSVLV
ncbi:MAG: hypothetical protein ACI84D_003267, partial [Thalassolituus oleivorans]